MHISWYEDLAPYLFSPIALPSSIQTNMNHQSQQCSDLFTSCSKVSCPPPFPLPDLEESWNRKKDAVGLMLANKLTQTDPVKVAQTPNLRTQLRTDTYYSNMHHIFKS